MNVPVKIPKHGLNMTKGLIVDIFVKPGDDVNVGDVLFQLETDKAVIDVESEYKGAVAEITAAVGEELPVGAPIVTLRTEDEASAAAGAGEIPHAARTDAPAVSVGKRNKALATPAARKYAKEHSADLALIRPKGSVIEKEDVEAYLRGESDIAPPRPAAPFEYRTEGKEKAERSRIQKRTAERLSYSFREIPHFWLVRDVDLSALEEERQAAIDQGGKIGIGDYLLAAAAKALAAHPLANAGYYADEIWYNPSVNVGYAVASPKGLVVPVVRDADKLGLDALSERRRALVRKALDGQIGPEDMEDGTFTVTNLASFGIDRFFAIINPPQAAILSAGRVKRQPAVSSGALKSVPVLTLSLAVDHRVLDGAEAADFLAAIAEILEGGTASPIG
ncbi:MAG: 2-oxo acid dehydrogenase subunit E2 [Clostridiales Family XIII bacterium]|jgi:pyruvate dehydrogenase E2 component (dihydrolipoamide acetyltransferase)|nr:2-oxo acid dehydrogenase subunit E2 [Clostridiales Family XIII bacterium]